MERFWSWLWPRFLKLVAVWAAATIVILSVVRPLVRARHG
jgi:hypothetical protein